MRVLTNGLVFTGGRFTAADLVIDGERVSGIGRGPVPAGAEVVDLAGARVVPGFVDLHFHGALGHDVMDDDPAALDAICRYQARSGTTSFLATTITAGMPALLAAVERIAGHPAPSGGARVLGLHIEGPFINPAQKGCHRVDWMKAPEPADHQALRARAAGAPLHYTVAPELPGAAGFIAAAVADGATVSLGHSDARAREVERGLAAGAGIFTHLFNAMRGLHHREPGVVGAALDSDAHVELICDGIHVAPEVVKLAWRMKGADRVVLVSDAMAAAGLGDGAYSFGGQPVRVEGGVARNPDGQLASSTITLAAALKNLVRFTGAPLEEALPAVTSNPARVLGMADRVGAIAPGRAADLVVLDDHLEIRAVYCRGRPVD